jgi:hypothetical protein
MVGQRNHLAALADARLDVGDVAHLAGAVDDDEQLVLRHAEEHQVVDDAALVVEQQAVALLAHGQVDHVHGHQALEGGSSIGADQAQLAHVRDVEQAGFLARVQVLGHQARRVLHGHGVTGERHHAGAQFDVQRVEGRGEQGCGGRCGHNNSRANGGRGTNATGFALLSALPERFTAAPWLARAACSFGGWPVRCARPPLSSKGTPASLRAVASPFA